MPRSHKGECVNWYTRQLAFDGGVSFKSYLIGLVHSLRLLIRPFDYVIRHIIISICIIMDILAIIYVSLPVTRAQREVIEYEGQLLLGRRECGQNATIYGEILQIRSLREEKKVSVLERCPLLQKRSCSTVVLCSGDLLRDNVGAR